jgi:two-component sensor histidine kinase
MTDSNDPSGGQNAAEIRHRMANALQLLGALARMRSQRTSEPEARRQLMWLADAIGSVGSLEKRRVADRVDFAGFLAEMAPIWRRRHSSQPADVVVQAEALMVPEHAASTLGLIAQELIGNALAHGFQDGRAGQVTVRLSRRPDGRCELCVRDDGQGFDPVAERERFGLWLVRSLAVQVRGEFTLDAGPGVTASLAFPL